MDMRIGMRRDMYRDTCIIHKHVYRHAHKDTCACLLSLFFLLRLSPVVDEYLMIMTNMWPVMTPYGNDYVAVMTNMPA